jgi:hypothetical protein
MGQSISGSIGTVVTKRSGWLGDFEEMAAEKRTIYCPAFTEVPFGIYGNCLMIAEE